jgi:hypothetical protein
MIDGNNVPNDPAALAALYGSAGKLVLNTENSRTGRRRSSSIGNANEIPGIPLPSELKAHHEILMLISSGETQAVMAMLRSLNVNQVVGIRGLNLEIDDIEESDGVIEDNQAVGTLMWNPLHFAVYNRNLELVKFLIKEMKVNLAVTAPKAPAESERDPVNNEKYTEDKIILLLLAYDRKHPAILRFLLDEGYKYWPSKKTIEKLLRERLLDEIAKYTIEMGMIMENGRKNSNNE